MILDGLENTDWSKSFRTASRLSGEFLACLESFRIVWKVSGLPKMVLACLESFWVVWKVSRLPEKFLSGNSPGWVESLRTL